MNKGSQTARPTAAAVVLERLHTLKEDANRTAGRIEERLASIVRQPDSPTAGEGKASEEMPILFAEMRSILLDIGNALSRINDTLDRVEI